MNQPSNNVADWVSLARDAFQASNSYFDASIRSQIEADIRQFQSQHPTGSKYLAEANRSRSRFFRPKTRATIRKNEAAAAEAFFSTNDVLAITPENDNDRVQVASASVMQELLQYRLTKTLPWFQLLVGAYQDAQTVGIVASEQTWLYDQRRKIDRPDCRLVPIENLRFDPGASWMDPVGTSPYLIELIPMYVKDVKARMLNPDPKTGAPKWRYLDDAAIMSATKAYGDTIRLQREQGRMDSKYATQQANSNYNIVWVHKNLIEVDGIDYLYYTLGCEHLLSPPIPLEQAVFHGKRPYVIGCCVIETHRTYPSGVSRLTKEVQGEINDIVNLRQDNLKLALNKRFFAKRNKQVDLRSLTRNTPGSVTLMQDVDDVKIVEFNDVTASSYKEQEVLNLDFDDVAGAFSGSSVQSNRKLNETVGGMKMLDANANQVSGYQLRTFVETWVEPVLRQLMLLEQYYETDETVLMLCGEAAQLRQKFGIDAVTDEMLMHEFTLKVNVGLGSTNPLDQVKQFLDGMNALRDLLADGSLVKYGLKVDEVIKELFGKLGYKDGTRFFDMGDNPRVEQLMNTINELQAALDAKVPPELLAAQVRKINAEIESLKVRDKKDEALAVKTGVEAAYSAMQGAEVIAAVPQVAPIADKVMQAAGYREPVPAGIDPNFPAPGAAAPGIGINPVQNRRTGMEFQPGTGNGEVNAPNPALPGTGVRQGIETQRLDGIAAAAYADGGLLDDDEPLPPPFDPDDPDGTGAIGAGRVRVQHPTGRGVAMMRRLDAGAVLGSGVDYADGAFERGGIDDNVFNYNLSGQTSVGNPMRAFAGMNSPFYSAYANGGVVVGPGTGTSDSVPAQVNGMPVAVSNGEYIIPAAVVAALGVDFFQTIVAQFHAPTGQEDGAMPEGEPLPLEDGSFVIPADTVQILGRDFFDKLVELHGQV